MTVVGGVRGVTGAGMRITRHPAPELRPQTRATLTRHSVLIHIIQLLASTCFHQNVPNTVIVTTVIVWRSGGVRSWGPATSHYPAPAATADIRLS